tara:strand:- start:407 stop:802 length:396 start_codon:yes stop_codon:yes gene_type:complete
MYESFTLKADRLIEKWARELSTEGSPNYAASQALDGNFAFSVAGQHDPLKNYLKPKVTRSPSRGHVDTELLLIDSIMSKIGKVNEKYPLALQHVYTHGTKEAAKQLHCSVTKAKELKNAAFDMVVLLLEET